MAGALGAGAGTTHVAGLARAVLQSCSSKSTQLDEGTIRDVVRQLALWPKHHFQAVVDGTVPAGPRLCLCARVCTHQGELLGQPLELPQLSQVGPGMILANPMLHAGSSIVEVSCLIPVHNKQTPVGLAVHRLTQDIGPSLDGQGVLAARHPDNDPGGPGIPEMQT